MNLDGEDPAGADSTRDDADEDVIPAELLDAVAVLSRDDYDVAAVLDRTFEDLDEIARFLAAASRLNARHDDKARKLARLLRAKDLAGRKVLVFTEFADTARYVQAQLKAAGIADVARIDSTSNVDRAEVIRRFSPYYNGSSATRLSAEGLEEIRVLVSTDVLSEGLNLQDATRLVNYDLHWNPVRMMQRIGRVDRRMNPQTEARLTADHPETATDRGTVRFWNFLPPEDLERILKLYERVTGKTLLISHTLGIEGRKLLRPDDAYDPLAGVQRRLRRHPNRYGGHALGISEAAPTAPRTGRGGSTPCRGRCSPAAANSPKAPGACSCATRCQHSTFKAASSPWKPDRPAGTSTTPTRT